MPSSRKVDDRIDAMGPYEFADLVRRSPRTTLPELLRRRFRTHLDEFCRYLWPDRFTLAFSDLHHSLFRLQRIPGYQTRAEDVRVAVAAPRGFAKSTIASFARIVHDIVYDREAYIVLLSAEQRLSIGFSRDLRQQFLQEDSKLARLYGPFEVTGGVKEWEVSVRGRPTVGVLPRSFGTAVRGSKHPTRGIRPTKVVVDDGEDKVKVRNPEQRTHHWEALTKDILKLGAREGGAVVEVVGTILHPDSMLSRLMSDPGWRAERWKAILAWPKRADLWERCRRIWADLTLGKNRRAAALAFYRANKRAMEEGAILLDPAAKDLFQLHELIWSEGLTSFLSELQNEPVDPTAQLFWSDQFKKFRVVGDELEVLDETRRRVRIRDLRKHGRWDPALGTPHGDFPAIAVVGRDGYGYSYVLDCWMRRAPPSVQLAAAWTLAERWELTRMTVEDNGFQSLVAEPYARERRARQAAGQYWRLQIRGEPSTEDKELRIATLEPDVTNGWMMFGEHIEAEVFQQFDQFPTGAHDDGPDAIHGAWAASGGRPAHMEQREAA